MVASAKRLASAMNDSPTRSGSTVQLGHVPTSPALMFASAVESSLSPVPCPYWTSSNGSLLLSTQLQHVAGVVPEDAGVELGDRDVGPAEGDLEGGLDRATGGDARARFGGEGGVPVDEAHARDAAELVLLGVVLRHRQVAGRVRF